MASSLSLEASMASISVSQKKKKVTLKSSDLEIIEVDEAVAKQSKTVRDLIEAGSEDSAIPLANVTGEVLRIVLKYCEKHASAGTLASFPSSSSGSEADEELKSWDSEYIKLDNDTLYDLLLAANYMEVKSLLDLGCQHVADKLKGKSPEQMRSLFNIENDFTPEQEAQIRTAHSWAFD